MKAWLSVGLLTFAAIPTSAHEFYAGRSITLVVANSAGSGYDAYARLLARHISKHIPGRPNVIVQNMPGAGGVKATDFIANVAPKDGTVLALTMPGALVDPLTGDPSKFDTPRTEGGHCARGIANSVAEAFCNSTAMSAIATSITMIKR